MATPNNLTFASFGLSLLASFLFLSSHPFWGGLMAQIASIIDGCDGEVARLKRMSSTKGAVIDTVLDRYADMILVSAMAFAYGVTTTSMLALFVASTGVIIFSYVWHHTGVRIPYAGRDVRLFTVMLGGILSSLINKFLLITLFVVGLLGHCGAVASLKQFIRNHRDQRP